jgi:hypothetical protein
MRPGRWRDAAAACGLAAVALVPRLALLRATPYGDESAHYAMARTLGFLDRSILWIGPEVPFQLYALTLGRPGFALLHFPAALHGFEAFRAFGILVAAALAPLSYALVRAHGGRWPAATVAGAAVALLPAFVVWGGRVFPDSGMALFALGGLLAWRLERPRLAAGLLLAACLVKETAIPLLATLAALALVRGVRSRRSLLPLTRGELWLLAALALSPAGILASYLAYPQLPGWTTGAALPSALELLVLSSWLLVPAAVGVLVPQTRVLAACLCGLLAFYALFILVKDGGVNGWYAIVPGALAIVTAALLVDHGLRSAGWPRLLAPPAAAALAFLLAAGVAGAGVSLAATLHPLDPRPEAGLASTVRFVHQEHLFLRHAIEVQESRAPRTVLQMDTSWFWIAYPFAGSGSSAFANTAAYPPDAIPVERLVSIAEGSDLTWLEDRNTTFHQAFRQTYSDCRVFEEGTLAAYDLRGCAGRAAGLRSAYEAMRAPSGA